MKMRINLPSAIHHSSGLILLNLQYNHKYMSDPEEMIQVSQQHQDFCFVGDWFIFIVNL